MAPDPDQLREFAERYTEAWCSQDPERLAAHYAPAASLTINDAAPSVGRAAITEAARSFIGVRSASPKRCPALRAEAEGILRSRFALKGPEAEAAPHSSLGSPDAHGIER